MRKEDFYDVFEYGDRLEPGVELKIEHSITMEYDTPDLTPFTNSDVKELESLRKISAGTEQKIFDSLKEPLSKWERQAALTKLLRLNTRLINGCMMTDLTAIKSATGSIKCRCLFTRIINTTGKRGSVFQRRGMSPGM